MISGDILVFLGGEGEIERCCDLIFARDEKRELWILPCYSSLPFEEQNKVFEPAPDGYKRKVQVSVIVSGRFFLSHQYTFSKL